jgi:chemotaxis protein methyltransferase CheR
VNQYSFKVMTPAGRDTLGVRVPERSAELLRDLVHSQTGMFYDESRLSFMLDRLTARAVERGFDSLLDYYYLLKYDPQAEEEWARAIDALAVQETYFWRENDQLRALTDAILPSLTAAGRLFGRKA